MPRTTIACRIVTPLIWACLIVAATAEAAPATKPKPPFSCTVGRVLDGDTFQCRDTTKVRLWGVNAAELPHYGKPGEPGANAAAAYLKGLIVGSTLTCHAKGRSYDRVVAICQLPDGADLGQAIVATGHAQDCAKFSKGAYATFEQPDVYRNKRMCGE